jgi:WhiB family transcriptional regulator, redox-sensing transcriptional regulator
MTVDNDATFYGSSSWTEDIPLLGERPEWQLRAACRGLAADAGNYDLFFPGQSKSATPAKTICGTCPVRTECEGFGAYERAGVWGGFTREERQARRRTRRAA